MASQDDDPFKNAVAKFQRSLTPKERQEFQCCTLESVEQTIKDLETTLAAKRKQPNMQRISKFIEGKNHLGQVVEVFLTVHATVTFVWGPIKFLLLIASTWVDSLDCLLDKYTEIGEVLPGLTQYRTLLDKHPNLRVHLENYYCDVLEFHREALNVFSRSNWRLMFQSFWKTFQNKFGGTLAKLKRHQQLLSDEKITAAIFEVRDLRQSVEDNLGDQKKQLEDKRQFVISKLDASGYHADLEFAFKQRGGGEYGDWILSNNTFQDWVEIGSMEDGVKTLYIHGIPGTDPSKRTSTALFASILGQLVNQDDVVLDSIYERLIALDHQEIRSGSVLQELLELAVISQRTCFIVIDELDECLDGAPPSHEQGQQEVVDWIQSLNKASNNNQQRLRILISAQRNGFLEKRLDNLLGQVSLGDLKRELAAENFPKDLEQV
ncbi:hypothetical protein QBC38DRAFT_510751 [Podospora fimiseda]|uniref:Uncharacterized protein n=1 Tax=Podospora fimiseda TaxID=252190 RepID=A0AAN7BMF7_9PEZI|nr:hypothetical protein QBC38DRAFT_510751 [Podospora fimiseda]